MIRGVAVAALLGLAGCASTVVAVAEAPFRAAGWTVDKLTTSQAEADRNRGRRDRRAEAKQRRAAKAAARRARRRLKRMDER